MVNEQAGLSNLQLELLKLFRNNIPEEDLCDIKMMLSKYFLDKATVEMDKIWEERGIKPEDMEQWANEHNRAKSSHRH